VDEQIWSTEIATSVYTHAMLEHLLPQTISLGLTWSLTCCVKSQP
jgi:hypothetical protein